MPAAAIVLTAVLVILEVSWAWHRTPQLFEWEPNKRQATRAQAEDFLAATSRPDDLLFGYEPLFLGAWERNKSFPDVVLPRADAVLALRTLERQPKPLGRGVWILDASERNNLKPRLEMENRDPGPPGLFETRVYGPFLILRTREPVGTEDAYLAAAARVMLVGTVARDRRRRRQHADDRARRPQPARLRAVGCASAPTPRGSRARSRTHRGRPASRAVAAAGRNRRAAAAAEAPISPPITSERTLRPRLSSRRACRRLAPLAPILHGSRARSMGGS